VAFFYQIPLDEEIFDPRKDFYKGELVPIYKIPNKEEGEVAMEGVYTPGADVVACLTRRYSLGLFPFFVSFRSFDDSLRRSFV